MGERETLAWRVGRLLRVEREKARMTQGHLAEVAGTTQQQVSQVENGRHAPTTALLERLFAALELQLRVDTEQLDGDLDDVIDRASDQDEEYLDSVLHGLGLILKRAGGLSVLVDGELAARLHGVPVPVRPA